MNQKMRLVLRFAAPLAAWFFATPVLAFHPQPVPTKPEHARAPSVALWESNVSAKLVSSDTGRPVTGLSKLKTFEAFEKNFKNGGELAAGDLDGDGQVEIIVGSGPERRPEVRVYSMDGKLLKSFRAYPAWFKGGVRVAIGDVDGDGGMEIVTAPGPGIEPQINIFKPDGTRVINKNELAYQKEFQGGVRVAVADFDGDGQAEIVTAPGPGGGPHVRVWNGKMENLGKDFFAFDAGMKDGITLSVSRTPDGVQVVTAPESWTAPLVRRFSLKNQSELVKEFYAFATSSRAGVSTAAFDADGDGVDEILAWRNGGGSPEVRQFDLYGTEQRRAMLLDPAYHGGLSLVRAGAKLAVMPVAPTVTGPLDVEKFIEVDLLRQRLYAYERGLTARTFLVSTGVAKYPTPVMETAVQKKVFLKDYRWTYGPNNPDNYNLPNVKWNLQIRGPFFIHYAYWHNNFGHRMSHGCINVGKADAEWIYNWADAGTKVVTHNGTLAAGASALAKK